MSAASSRSDEWHIKGVSHETRRKLKLFAISHDLTLAEALDKLVDLATANDTGNHKQSGTKHVEFDDSWLEAKPLDEER